MYVTNIIATTKTSIAIQAYTPQPVNGITYPLPKNDIQITPIGLVIVVTQANVLNFMFVIPAIKHKISSGNIGSKNAIAKKNAPRFLKISEYLSVFSFPAIHATILYPKVLPIKNETKEPISIPIEQYRPPSIGP